MTKIKKAIQYIFIAIIAIPVILFYHFFFMCPYSKNPSKIPFEKRYQKARRLSSIVVKAFFSRYFTYNLDVFNKSEKQGMLVINHYSNLDPLVVCACCSKPVTFVGKVEAFSFPFVGKILKVLEAYPLDRDNVVSQFTTIKNIVSHLKDEKKPPIVVFIEGTRNKHPETPCLPFHPGTLKMAAMAGVNVYPSALYGSFRHLTLKSFLHHYPIFVNIADPITPEEVKNSDLNELAEKVRKNVDDKVNEFRKMDQCFIYRQLLTNHRKALETIVDIGVKS